MGAAGLLAAGASILLGMLLAFQAPINAMLGRALGSPISAALASLVVSMIAALVIAGLVGDGPAWRAPPIWLYVAGGLIGATFVVGSVFIVPTVGAASFLASVVLGQLLSGLVIDHLGAFGLPIQEVSVGRLAAVGCVLLGVVLLRLA